MSVSAGAGHVRAAQAVEAALREQHPGVEVRNIDAMEYVPAPFKRLYTRGYISMVNSAPALWGYLYDLAEKSTATRMNRFAAALQRIQAPRLFRMIREFAPDRIVCTHFFLPQILSAALAEGRWTIPIDVVVTDYDVHAVWIEPGVSRYYVAHEALAYRLKARGIAGEKIRVTGIPIHPDFLRPVDRLAVLRSMELDPALPTLLLMAGGLGMGPLVRSVEAIARLPLPLQVISVAGRNEELKAGVDAIRPENGTRVVSLGFATNMPELLTAADIVASKPGGLTTSECLAKRVALVAVSPIPGQEERNADYLMESGAGLKAANTDDLEYKVLTLLRDPARLAALRENAGRIARPRAAYEIADAVIADARGGGT